MAGDAYRYESPRGSESYSPRPAMQAGAVARFRREVQAAAKLHHPNVVTAYDAEQVGNTHFLVVEYIEGQTLASQVAKGPLTIQAACQAAHDAALG